jgi:integrase
MVHKDGASGSFILDRVIPGLGRIKMASGTTHAPTFRRLNTMLTDLKEQAHFDVLRAIKAKRIAPLVVLEYWRSGRLGELPTAEAMRPLAEALEAWRAGLPQETAHTRNQKYNIKHLTDAAGGGAPVQDLAVAVRKLRATLAATPRQFNSVRATALAFARDTAGRTSPVWRAVADVPIYGRKAVQAASRRQPRPVMPRELRAIGERMTPEERAQLWTMALTGMRPKEYFGDWQDRGADILVRGTKTEAAHRVVPRVALFGAPARHAWKAKKFREVVTEASRGEVQVYDLRRTFARWMEEAGIIRARRKLYFGHSTGDVTALYERHDVAAFVAEDTAKLEAWIAAELATKADQTPNLKAI